MSEDLPIDNSELMFRLHEMFHGYRNETGVRMSREEILLQLVCLERGDVLNFGRDTTSWTITRNETDYQARAWVNTGEKEGIRLEFATLDSPDPREILKFVEERSQ